MVSKKASVTVLLFITILWIAWVIVLQKWSPKKMEPGKVARIEKLNTYLNPDTWTLDISKQIVVFWKEINNYQVNKENGDFEAAIKASDIIITNIGTPKTEEQKIRQVAAKFLKTDALLNEGNYSYREKEFAIKAEKELKDIQSSDGDLFDSPYGMYYIGYSKEIQKEYEKAIEYYSLGLRYAQDDGRPLAILYNQIGHVYDLMGDMTKAYEYYRKAYDADKTNFMASANIGRYLYRTGKTKDSIPYFQYALNSPNKSIQSEMYYSLSSIMLELDRTKPDIDKSLEYARKSIESYQRYPMGYVAIARALYMKNDKKYDKEIEENLGKSIKLNPNGCSTYRYYALHIFDTGNLKEAIKMLEKAIENTDKDILLMNNDRKDLKEEFKHTMVLLWLTYSAQKDSKVTMEIVGKRIATIPFGKKFLDNQMTRKDGWVFYSISGTKEYMKKNH